MRGRTGERKHCFQKVFLLTVREPVSSVEQTIQMSSGVQTDFGGGA